MLKVVVIECQPGKARADAAHLTALHCFPTLRNLEMPGKNGTAENATELAAARTIVSVLLWKQQHEDGNGNYLCMPGQEECAASEERKSP